MAAVGVFEIEEGQAHSLHLRRHLARMHRGHPIILGRGDKEGLGVGDPGFQIVIWRDRFEEGGLLRVRYAAVLTDPRGPGPDLFEAQHIQQRHLNDHGVE